uniref:Uncharacterized protein n=1 Tax=Rhizophora mucronata TaxID=61149 RepID=A0A2P2JWG5_RHIMU
MNWCFQFGCLGPTSLLDSDPDLWTLICENLG